ncbi:hemerythrin family protein [Magnetovibrio sp. PR-2]|uniref:bacteriohemerythrin n=1 Tax=Magnetovibrio sp. PR-2 TaxID=3120356 RepID=UPI002FCE0740
MKLFKWSDAYLTKIRVVDDDHKNLYEMFKLMHNAYATNKDPAKVKNIVERLQVYVDHHFEREEQLMEGANYPKYDQHVEIHRKYQAEIESLTLLINKEPETIHLGKIVAYLSTWLDNHIRKVDMHYAKYMRGPHVGKRAQEGISKEPKTKEILAEVPLDKVEVIEQFIELALADKVPETLQKQIEAHNAQKLARARKLFAKE